jgi:hypothetical protein
MKNKYVSGLTGTNHFSKMFQPLITMMSWDVNHMRSQDFADGSPVN